MQRLKIVKDSLEYFLPERLVIMDDSQENRTKVADRAFGHGAVDISDGMKKPKIVRIEGILDSMTYDYFRTLTKLLKEKIDRTEYQLYRGEYYINIEKMLKFHEPYIPGGDYSISRFAIDLLALDPFWYSPTLQEPETTIDSSPKEFTITNNGNVDTHPIITITADKTITDLIIQNETDIPEGEDEGLKFQYQDPAFFNGNIVTVDCRQGTVYRGTTNTIRYLDGAFLRLLPGVNSIKYTGDTNGETKVKFQFYERFL